MTFPNKNDYLKRALDVVLDKPANAEQPAKKKKVKMSDTIHPKRKIAIKFLYHDWEHEGVPQNSNTMNFVETNLREALLRTQLIKYWSSCDFSICGRADRAVAAFQQVAAFVVRARNLDDSNVFWPAGTPEDVKTSYQSKTELPYLKMLNDALPATIKVVAWCDVPRDFSAHHDCNMRIYKYSLPKASLNIEKMRDAAARLVGKHDFRNFSQIEMSEARVVMSYVREIFDVTIEEITTSDDPSSLLELTVKGRGFLWHIIRVIVTVLHEVGKEKEEPEIVSKLLDIETYSHEPSFDPSVDSPLCLIDCRSDKCEMKWIYDPNRSKVIVRDLHCTMADLLTKARLMKNMIDDLMTLPDFSSIDINKGLLDFNLGRALRFNYVPKEYWKICRAEKMIKRKREGREGRWKKKC